MLEFSTSKTCRAFIGFRWQSRLDSMVTCHLLIIFTFLISSSSKSFSATTDGPRIPSEASTSKTSPEIVKDFGLISERLRAIESRLDREGNAFGQIIEAQRQIGIQTIEAQRRYADYITLGVGAVVFVLGAFGITQVSRLTKYVNQAKKEAGSVTELRQEAARNELDVKALIAVTRVMSRIWQSDQAAEVGNQAQKERWASEALQELHEAERLGNLRRSPALRLEKGKALKRLKNYPEALVEANMACELARQEGNKFDEARGHYNSACYLALSGQLENEAIERLKQAIHLSPVFKTFAENDKDLDSLRNLPAFKTLVSLRDF
jgi:hypothetical protein